jgi:hypothetical protein
MKASELRIGNLVKYDNRIFEIDSIAKVFPTLNTDEFGIGVIDYNNIEPIFLTIEWLLKIGFVYQEKNQWFELNVIKEDLEKDIYDLSIISLGDIDTIPAIWIGNFAKNIGFDVADNKCTYVHQIQNLYFALTGKELEYEQA